MKLALALLSLAFSSQVFAAEVSCSLKTGKDVHVSTIELVNGKENQSLSNWEDWEHDITFDLIGSCEKNECSINVTFYSAKAEDEVGNSGWTLNLKSEEPGVFVNEPVDGAPDKRKYNFSCEFQK